MKDLIIIGSGPAGLSAAVYACNAQMDFAVIERYPLSGGQVLNTTQVNNYLGFADCDGALMSDKFRKHAESMGTTFINDEVVAVSKSQGNFDVKCRSKSYSARAVIFAGGASRKHLGVKGEEPFSGRGVSYCATCDGGFFKNKTVAVVGGGDVACEDALYLANLCKTVYLIHRRDTLRAEKYLQEKVFNNDNITTVFNANVIEIFGRSTVEGVTLDNGETLSLDGVFIAVGVKPETEFLQGFVNTDEQGFVIADESCKTSTDGFFAAGDVRTKPLRQISTAVGDGANAVKSAEEYFNKLL